MNRGSPPDWWPRWRRFKDQGATVLISAGGGVVLLTIVSLFVFLVYETLPLLRPASLQSHTDTEWRTASRPPVRWISGDEYGVVAFSLDAGGEAAFSLVDDGSVLRTFPLGDDAAKLRTVAGAGTGQGTLALGFDDGGVLVIDPGYRYAFTENERRVTPVLAYPHGETRRLLRPGNEVRRLALAEGGKTLAVQFAGGELDLVRIDADAAESRPVLAQWHRIALGLQPEAAALHILDDNRWLLLLQQNGQCHVWSLEDGELWWQGDLFAEGEQLSASTVLQGGMSLLAASSGGRLTRYFVSRDGRLRPVREFDLDGEVVDRLIPEHRRRGFIASNSRSLWWFNATSGERSLKTALDLSAAETLSLSLRADLLLAAQKNGELRRWALENPHPEVSISSLWRRVWYEGYQQPEFVYQSSASSNDYEAKFSLTPLAFGTLKAAFYAMLFATPMAICGAIYTAFFMAPALRRRVKPLVELMEALPTVILGFLAGLWLAPLVEDHLSELLSLIITLPLGVLLFAGLWSRLPLPVRRLVPDGWHAIILIPVILVLVWAGFALGSPVETLLFDGDTRRWLSEELGLAYDQRNAMVVGIAMGFAVIPTIFSIAEDAIYSVPRHLSYGSLALGATPWQTLVGVVLPTASPGVFSALMIGFGRAVGETMIVLMATGNTPIMDVNLFEGMRTLAANIAVEVPEAEVDSTHYRILFLAAFVLFLFTFAVNTLAEVVRQRLRARYGALG